MGEFPFRTPLFLESGKFVEDILIEQMNLSENFHKKQEACLVVESATDSSRDRIEHKGRYIERYVFNTVYADYKNYPERSDILMALGFRPDEFGTSDEKRQQNMAKSIQRIVNRFNDDAVEKSELLPTFINRKRFYVDQARKEHGGFDEDDFDAPTPTMKDINGGSRNRRDRTSRTLERINSEDVMAGEFYSNITRISKSSWSSWLRFWDKTKSAVSRDVSLFGREWAKHFIMGYQIEPKLLYEIWYNSIDSTFTVHDVNGGEVSRRVKTMTEAMNNMIKHIVQSSPSDAAVFRGSNPQARQISRSIQNSLFNDTDHHAKQLQAMDNEASREERAQRRLRRKEEERLKQQAKDKIDATIDYFKRAAADDEENKKFFKVADPQPDDPVWKNEPTEDDIERFNKKADEEDRKFRARKAAAEEELRKQQQAADEAKRKANIAAAIDAPLFSTENKPDYTKDFPKPYVAPGSKAIRQPDEGGGKRDRVDTKDIDKREKEARAKIEKMSLELSKPVATMGKPKKVTKKKVVNESASDNMEFAGTAVNAMTASSSYEREIKNLRNQADRSRFTQELLKNQVLEGIEKYDTTRAPNQFMTELERLLNTGRSEPIVLPTDEPSIYKKFKAMIRGQRYRSDFITGFSLNGKINLEIWYVTEPNPEYSGRPGQARTVSSYYVFDVTSLSKIRGYLPYYRNAIQVVMAKLGAY